MSNDRLTYTVSQLNNYVKSIIDNDPYLNYIINGTYNYITYFIKSDNDKVTVEQCRFLLEYLKVIGQVRDEDAIAKINTLQSSVRSLLNSTLTPVDKHIRTHRLFRTH